MSSHMTSTTRADSTVTVCRTPTPNENEKDIFRIPNGETMNCKNTMQSFANDYAEEPMIVRAATKAHSSHHHATAAASPHGVHDTINNNNTVNHNYDATVHAVAVLTSVPLVSDSVPVVEPENDSDTASQQQQLLPPEPKRRPVTFWLFRILILFAVMLVSVIGVYCGTGNCSLSSTSNNSDGGSNNNSFPPVTGPPICSSSSLSHDLAGNNYGVFKGEIPISVVQQQSYTLRLYYNESGMFSEVPGICPREKGMITIVEQGFIQFMPSERMDGDCVGGGIAELTKNDDDDVDGKRMWDYTLRLDELVRTDTGSVSFECASSSMINNDGNGIVAIPATIPNDTPSTTAVVVPVPSTAITFNPTILELPVVEPPIKPVLEPPASVPSIIITSDPISNSPVVEPSTTSDPVLDPPVTEPSIITPEVPIVSIPTTTTCRCESTYDTMGNPHGVFKGEISTGYSTYQTVRIYYNISGIFGEVPGFCPRFKGELTIVEKGYIQYLPREFSDERCVSAGIIYLNDTMDGFWEYLWRYDANFESNSGYVTLECVPLICDNAQPVGAPTASLLQDSAGNPYGIYSGEITTPLDGTYTMRIEYNSSGIFDQGGVPCPIFRGRVTIAERGYIQYLPREYKDDNCLRGGIVDLIDTMDGIWEYTWRQEDYFRTDTGYLTYMGT